MSATSQNLAASWILLQGAPSFAPLAKGAPLFSFLPIFGEHAGAQRAATWSLSLETA
jgi:hypothetical protein